MTGRAWNGWVVALAALASLAQGVYGQAPVLRRSPEMIAAFKEVVAGPSASTVRVTADGADAALGAIVGADGWVVTKASLLKGKLACKLKDGRTLDAKYVGLEVKHDLALLKVEATGLRPVQWADSKEAEVGDWVAAPTNGADAAAVGVV